VGLALIFFAGYFVRDRLANPQRSDTAGYALLHEVQALLDRHFLREQPDAVTREYAAIRGMLATLNDRYTFFIDPPVAASESNVLAGTYGGIGVQVSRAANGDFVLFPFDESPAEAAGIENGDILIAVNGTPVQRSLSQDAVDQLLRGEVRDNNGVEVSVDKASGARLTVYIPFGVINVPSVIWRVLSEDTRFGYIQIVRFTARTPSELQQAISELRGSGIISIVLDLRNNTGGLLQEAIDVADEFLRDGIIVTQVEPSRETNYTADAEGEWLDAPLVVLVNELTASGAELVAGALRDRDRAVLIGRKTFGKGTVQQIFQLADRSSLHVTSAEWFTPTRRPLDTAGLEPDISLATAADGRDVDLAAAIEYLAAQASSGIVQNRAGS
jgi:carboxyl-terminal processing protease